MDISGVSPDFPQMLVRQELLIHFDFVNFQPIVQCYLINKVCWHCFAHYLKMCGIFLILPPNYHNLFLNHQSNPFHPP